MPRRILHWSRFDPSLVRGGPKRWRHRKGDERRTPTSETLADMMAVYHATGARTGELCSLRVKDFYRRSRQLCLGKHKRSATQAEPTVRSLQLGSTAFSIVAKHAKGKAPDDPLFTRRGVAWTQDDVNRQFRAVRKLAKKSRQPIGDHLTPYSFRHLYITELLALGTPLSLVAKMTGTSVREIDRTYGHFFNRDLADWQQRLDAHRNTPGEDKGESHPAA